MQVTSDFMLQVLGARDVEAAALRVDYAMLEQQHAALLQQIEREVAAIDTGGVEPAATFKLRALELIARATQPPQPAPPTA
jgi:hypothetical protein